VKALVDIKALEKFTAGELNIKFHMCGIYFEAR
jgi:hypothetical protein